MCCGQLAASVAHEINTPTHFVHYNIHFLQDAFTDLRRLLDSYEKLAAVAGSGAVTPIQIEELKALVEELDIDYLKDEIPQAIEQSLDGLQRITKIVQSMKEFSHPGTDEKALCDLNRAIESTIDVSRNEWKYVLELVTELDPGLPDFSVLLGEFNQVILNLIINAAHAISDAHEGESSTGEIRIVTRSEKDFVVVTLSDNGIGYFLVRYCG
jgi:two-component system NtrC family sensor kinase